MPAGWDHSQDRMPRAILQIGQDGGENSSFWHPRKKSVFIPKRIRLGSRSQARGALGARDVSAIRPSSKEGTGKAGHRLIPMARVQKESTRRSPQDQPVIRPSLRDGLTAYTRSPRCAGLSGHRHLREAELLANLILASEYQDHAISPSGSRRSSTCMTHAATEAGHRIPRQRFVTFAKRPSDRAGCTDQIMNSEKKKQESF